MEGGPCAPAERMAVPTLMSAMRPTQNFQSPFKLSKLGASGMLAASLAALSVALLAARCVCIFVYMVFFIVVCLAVAVHRRDVGKDKGYKENGINNDLSVSRAFSIQ